MGSPATGYDISQQLAKATSSATTAVSGGINSVTAAAAAKTDSTIAKTTITGLGKVVEKQVGSLANNAASKLQQQIGGTVSKVNTALDRVNKIKTAVGQLGDLKNKLPGVAGSLAKSAGGAGKIAGLAKSLAGGGSLNEQDEAATSATSLINAKLADTLFTTKPDDKLVVVDAFGIKDNSTLNTIVDKLSGQVRASLNDLGGLSGIGKNLLSGVLRNGNINLNTDALKERLIDSLGGKAGIINKLSGGLREGLSEMGLPAGVYDRVEATIQGVTQYMTSSNVRDARGTFDLLARITGESEIASFLDVGAEAQLMSSLTRSLIDLGVPNAISTLMDKSRSSEAAYYALQSNIIVAANVADTKTIDMMIDELGVWRVLSDCPDLIHRTLVNYKFPEGMERTAVNYDSEWSKLDTQFKRLDVNWGHYRRGNQYITDMSFFSDISEDALELLSLRGPFTLDIRMANSYPKKGLTDLMSEFYPGILIEQNYSYVSR